MIKTHSLALLLAALIGLLILPASAAAELPRLAVDGNRFVNPGGETVVLRGVSFADPADLAERGVWNRKMFEKAAAWNCNLIRIPVHPTWLRREGLPQYLEWLDQSIAWAGELGMYVIIDWHTIGNPRTELFFRDIYETSMKETLDFWRVIADRYRGNPVAAFYEIWNEPTSINGRLGRLTWAQHKAEMEEIIYLIYAHDREVIPLVGGLDWAFDISYALNDPIDAPGIGYVTHPYPQKRPEPWGPQWDKAFGDVAAKYPVVATEFGFMAADDRGAHNPVISDERYGHAIIDYFEKHGISWTAWVFDVNWTPNLLLDWDYTPSVQGKLFRRKLLELNP